MKSTDGEIQFRHTNSLDRDAILEIAGWYSEEWNAPLKKILAQLSGSDDVILHLAAMLNDEVVAAGGLYNEVNLFKVRERFRKYKPWIGLLYTKKSYRDRGIGTRLLNRIEADAGKRGLDRIYLYTFTAESLYRRCGWKVIDRVPYKGHETAVMEKRL